jgi:hypothetical protein
MLIDHKIIVRDGAREVISQQHELHWPDGSMQVIHPVWAHDMPEPFLRALPIGSGSFVIFDVTKLAPELDADMRSAPPRDQVGLVFFSMRRHFASADAFRAAACREGRLVEREREAA